MLFLVLIAFLHVQVKWLVVAVLSVNVFLDLRTVKKDDVFQGFVVVEGNVFLVIVFDFLIIILNAFIVVLVSI